jgi:hypothetical protein
MDTTHRQLVITEKPWLRELLRGYLQDHSNQPSCYVMVFVTPR